MKINEDDSYGWTYTFGGANNDAVLSMVYYDNHLYYAGQYSGTVDFDLTSGTSSKTSKGNTDFFLSKIADNSNAPTITLNKDISYTNTTTPEINGVASDSYGTVVNVWFQIDSTSGSWIVCPSDDGSYDEGNETFTCPLSSSFSQGSHTLYFKSEDSYGNTTFTTRYTDDGFVIDTLSPFSSYTNEEGAQRTFESITKETQEEHLTGGGREISSPTPDFSFVPSSDTGSGISKYQVLLYQKNDNSSSYSWDVYLDDIPASMNDGEKIDNDRWYLEKQKDSYFIHGKGKAYELPKGAYKWKVRSIDKAGNTRDTEETIMRYETSEANFSGSYNPLQIESVGNKKILLSSLQKNTENLSPIILDLLSSPIKGIAPVKNTVTVVLISQSDPVKKYSRSIIVPQNSHFSLPFPTSISPGIYTMKLSTINDSKDYVEIPELVVTMKK